jgi:hypothetical protein
VSNTLALKPGTRLRTGGTTYEVTEDAHVPAGVVPVVPQAARLLKVFCTDCGYTARITQRWITKSGTPDCPACHINMVVAPKVEKAPKAAPVVPPVEYATAPPMAFVPLELDEPVDEPTPEPDTAEQPSALAELLAELN